MSEQAERAKRLHKEAIVIDTHIDTILELLLCPQRDFQKRGDWAPAGVTEQEADRKHYRQGDGQLDLPRMIEGGETAGFFVITNGDSVRGIPGTVEAIDRIYQEVERSPDRLMVATTAEDIRQAKREGKVAAVMSVEGGMPAGTDLEFLHTLHDRGVRCVALSGYVTESKHLTPFGRELVAEIEKLDMLVDVCHLASPAFWDTMEITESIVVDSHTNAWALVHTEWRNRRDDEIKALAQRGGVMGMNSYPTLVGTSVGTKVPGDPPLLQRLIDHIDYFANLVGPGHVGLGLDFDGMHAFSPVLRDVTEVPKITEELVARGYSDEDIKKILGGNWLRVIEQVVG